MTPSWKRLIGAYTLAVIVVLLMLWTARDSYRLGYSHGTADATAQHRPAPPKAIRPLAPRP